MPPEIMLKRKKKQKILSWTMPLLSFILFIVLWNLGYQFTKFLPSPGEVTSRIVEFSVDPETYLHIGDTLRRLVIGLFLGIVLGTSAAIISRFKRKTKNIIDIYVFVALTMPSMAVAFISLMLFGISELGVYVAVAVITFPFITLTLQEGLKSLDEEQLKMSKVYKLSSFDLFRHIIIPHMNPYFFAAIRNTHALGWKVVIVAEVFSTRTGIGYKFNHAFDNFSMANLVIWLLFFLGVVMFLEYVVLRQIEKRVFRWRDGNSSVTNKQKEKKPRVSSERRAKIAN